MSDQTTDQTTPTGTQLDQSPHAAGTTNSHPMQAPYPMLAPRIFTLVRDVDVSGVSGTGLVAWGVVFPDGKVATRWNGAVAQTCVWDSIADVEAIHGHGGATRVEWLDGERGRADRLQAQVDAGIDADRLYEYLAEWSATCRRTGLKFSLRDAAQFVADAGLLPVLAASQAEGVQ